MVSQYSLAPHGGLHIGPPPVLDVDDVDDVDEDVPPLDEDDVVPPPMPDEDVVVLPVLVDVEVDVVELPSPPSPP